MTANIFNLDNIENFSEKLNIDELYEKKKQRDFQQLELFNKILNRIHVKIKTTSKHNHQQHCCWFEVPEFILGIPKYSQGSCIAYVMDKLKTNGFYVYYYHPNILFISWDHWVPSYIRDELKKKTGIEVNEYGEKIMSSTVEEEEVPPNHNESSRPKRNYTPIQSYKPSGNLREKPFG